MRQSTGRAYHGFDVNTLTVVATENYEQFAENLQKEFEKETDICFGVIARTQFAAILLEDAHGNAAPLGAKKSQILWECLKATGSIDTDGKVQDALKFKLKEDTLQFPDAFEVYKSRIAVILRKVSGRLDIKNADERRQVSLRKDKDGKAVCLGDEFKALWSRIKHKTTYRVQFDNTSLIESCITALQDAPTIAHSRLQWRNADIATDKEGIDSLEKEGAATIVLDEVDIHLPDVLTELQDRTQLTCRTIVNILMKSERLDDFKRNPQ